jgi:hypothetical protein
MPLSEEQKAIIAKLESPLLILSIDERRLVKETLLAKWLTPKEWKDLKRQRQLEQYEVARELARAVVPHGQRENFVAEKLYGRSHNALMQFIGRIRRRKQP